jgi:hypothetical protein
MVLGEETAVWRKRSPCLAMSKHLLPSSKLRTASTAGNCPTEVEFYSMLHLLHGLRVIIKLLSLKCKNFPAF